MGRVSSRSGASPNHRGAVGEAGTRVTPSSSYEGGGSRVAWWRVRDWAGGGGGGGLHVGRTTKKKVAHPRRARGGGGSGAGAGGPHAHPPPSPMVPPPRFAREETDHGASHSTAAPTPRIPSSARSRNRPCSPTPVRLFSPSAKAAGKSIRPQVVLLFWLLLLVFFG